MTAELVPPSDTPPQNGAPKTNDKVSEEHIEADEDGEDAEDDGVPGGAAAGARSH